jgi:tetratricopeptide (TPR) repeat protein
MEAVLVAMSVSSMGIAHAAGGGSMSNSNVEMPEKRMSPEEQAVVAYNMGVRKLKDAAEHEQDAAQATEPKKMAKANDKARKTYERALKDFSRATDYMPTMHEAWNYVGFTQRHLGKYDASLAAYAKALQLRPNYPEAIEYRGEAYLGLNAIDDAKQAFLALTRTSPALAGQLLKAMEKWIAQRRDNPSGIDAATLQAFEAWTKEQSSTALSAAALSRW